MVWFTAPKKVEVGRVDTDNMKIEQDLIQIITKDIQMLHKDTKQYCYDYSFVMGYVYNIAIYNESYKIIANNIKAHFISIGCRVNTNDPRDIIIAWE